MSTKPLPMLELRDLIAKAIADSSGHGMREKCEKQADAVLSVVMPQLSATAEHAIAHLSAQAKVRVGDSNFESWFADEFKAANKGTKQHLREAYEAGMNDPAARLSQGAQGEAVFRYPKKPLPRAHGYLDKSGVEWAAYDTTQMEAYARQAVAENTRHAERAAVPDGWRETIQEAIDCIADVAQFKGSLKIGIYRHIGGKLRALLTAAPQPPEGAGVVDDDETLRVSRRDLLTLLDHNLDAANEAIQSTAGIDFIEEHGGPDSEEIMERVAYHLYYGLLAAERLRNLLAAPTLARKEGA